MDWTMYITNVSRGRFSILAGMAFVSVVAGLSVMLPGPASCALVNYADLDTMADGSRVERDTSAGQRSQFMKLRQQASARIAERFGAPLARPIIVFLKNPIKFYPFEFNPYGTTHFLISRACVVVGPEGMNTDVVAHEMMHAELFERVGFWGRLTEIPVWFDEGLSMQVDFRSEFDEASNGRKADIASVRKLVSMSQFFVSDSKQLKRNFSFAKAEVAAWTATVGRAGVYSRLARIRDGEPFRNAVEP
jgi:hypothetical protein